MGALLGTSDATVLMDLMEPVSGAHAAGSCIAT